METPDDGIERAGTVAVDGIAAQLAALLVGHERAVLAAVQSDGNLELVLAGPSNEIDKATHAVRPTEAIGTINEDSAICKGDEQIPVRRKCHSVWHESVRESLCRRDRCIGRMNDSIRR